MKARMKDNLIAAQEEGYKTIAFLRSIENQEVELVFTAGDAFEREDNNTWLPDELWDAI